jgi:hypothetical protein
VLGNNARVYLIGPGKTGQIAGRFILRRRKRAPWSGYAAPLAKQKRKREAHLRRHGIFDRLVSRAGAAARSRMGLVRAILRQRPGISSSFRGPLFYEAISRSLGQGCPAIGGDGAGLDTATPEGRLDYLSDESYRENALAEIFTETRRPRQSYRRLSLADCVIRALLADVALGIDALRTNDESAFHDVCRIRDLEMISILRDT